MKNNEVGTLHLGGRRKKRGWGENSCTLFVFKVKISRN